MLCWDLRFSQRCCSECKASETWHCRQVSAAKHLERLQCPRLQGQAVLLGLFHPEDERTTLVITCQTTWYCVMFILRSYTIHVSTLDCWDVTCWTSGYHNFEIVLCSYLQGQAVLLGLSDPEDKGTTIFQNSGNHSSNNSVTSQQSSVLKCRLY